MYTWYGGSTALILKGGYKMCRDVQIKRTQGEKSSRSIKAKLLELEYLQNSILKDLALQSVYFEHILIGA